MTDDELNASFVDRTRALDADQRQTLHRALAKAGVPADRQGHLDLDGPEPRHVRGALARYAEGKVSLAGLLDVLAAASTRGGASPGSVATDDPPDHRPVAIVSIHPPSGTYRSALTIYLSCSTPGARIRYTVDGSEPDANSVEATSPLRLEQPADLRARAFVGSTGGASSIARYVLEAPPPSVTPEGGDHHPPVTVELTAPCANARVAFTLEDGDPTEDSAVPAPLRFNLDRAATLRARTYVEGWQPSPIREVEFRIAPPTWRTLEPEDPTDAVPHEARGILQGDGDWVLVGASLRGRLHAHRGGWRDDAFALARTGGWHILVVADGAGSSPLARVGARLACDSVRSRLETRLPGVTIAARDADTKVPADEDLLRLRQELVAAFLNARSAVQEEARLRGTDVGAFSTTLITVVHRTWKGMSLVASLQVGDGAVALTGATGLRLLSVADSGEYAGETRFLTSDGVDDSLADRVRFTVQPDVDLLAAMTDGVADDFFPAKEKLPAMLQQVLPLAGDADHGPERLLEWLRYERRGSFDDRTVALLRRRT